MSEIGIFPNKSYRSKNNSPRCKASFSVGQSNHGRPAMDTSDICFLVQRVKTFEGLQLAQRHWNVFNQESKILGMYQVLDT